MNQDTHPDATGQIVLRSLVGLASVIDNTARVLVITSPSQRFVHQVREALPDREIAVFDQAKVHVPHDTVMAALHAAETFAPTVLLTVGGGAATGLGKMLRIRGIDAMFVAVATTYAGSERTRIWGTTTFKAGNSLPTKQTGRDDGARPDAIVHDPSLLGGLPRDKAVQSLLNALAHPVSALSAGIDDDAGREDALSAIRTLSFAVQQAIAHHSQNEVRANALHGVRRAGDVLNRFSMGEHHRLAHALGGALCLDHAALHAVLLPHSLMRIRSSNAALFERIESASRISDLPGAIHDALARVSAPTGLGAMGIDQSTVRSMVETLAEDESGMVDVATDAWRGFRPLSNATVEHDEEGGTVVIDVLDEMPDVVVLALHGRGSSAHRAIAMVRETVGHRPNVAVVAPQSESNAWYALPYDAHADALGPELNAARSRVRSAFAVAQARFPNARKVLFGFSQGACLALNVVLNDDAGPFDSVHALAGALPAASLDGVAWPDWIRDTTVSLSLARADKWIRLSDVEQTAASFNGAAKEVSLRLRPGASHGLTDFDRDRLRRSLVGRIAPAEGFGGAHRGEVLTGAVPRRQNSPRHAPYGLVSEQFSATGFVAPRHRNQRTWMYRVRPSAQHSTFAEISNHGVSLHFDHSPMINLKAWTKVVDERPLREDAAADFVDGLHTLGGSGSPGLRRGYAVHQYRATKDMENRAFTNVDGDLVILPQAGRLLVLTELGTFDLDVGSVLIVPRGMRFSVTLKDEEATGYVAEVFAGQFALPERGPVGANALVDERHFIGPSPFYEDRLAVGYRMTSKFGGALYEATQDFSPYDVVGWHGTSVPSLYRFTDFSPVANVAFDHADPSIFTVLTAPLDEEGANALDLVVFPSRWDPTENTFKPPYFHRNVTTEINGILRDPNANGPFTPGMVFVTPSMTPHGVRAQAVANYLAKTETAANRATKSPQSALWFQFETALHFHQTEWAKTGGTEITDWHSIWGEHLTRFNPRSTGTQVAHDDDK